MYRFVQSNGDYLELCDECGFHGGLFDASEAPARFRELPADWRSVFSLDDELIRARPEPDVWCAVEYALHTANAIEIIEWAARQVATGTSPDWDRMPAQFEPEVHDCDPFEHAATLDAGATAAESMAAFAASLTPQELEETADYGGTVLNTFAVIRHALHDAEHHLLDIRRNIARLQLTADGPRAPARRFRPRLGATRGAFGCAVAGHRGRCDVHPVAVPTWHGRLSARRSAPRHGGGEDLPPVPIGHDDRRRRRAPCEEPGPHRGATAERPIARPLLNWDDVRARIAAGADPTSCLTVATADRRADQILGSRHERGRSEGHVHRSVLAGRALSIAITVVGRPPIR